MNNTETKPVEARSFVSTETITVETKTPQPLPSIFPSVPLQNQISPIRDIWQRREGVRLSLVGEIGRDKSISLSAVKYHVMRHPEEVPKIININSGGGNIDEAFRIYEWLHALPIPLAVVADTRCCSAAVVVFLAADLRISNPNTQLLLHRTHIGTEGFPSRLNAQDLQRYVNDLKADDDRTLDLLEARTGFDRSRFEAEMSDESNMSDVFAVESGIVHEWPGLNRVDHTWPEAARQMQAAGVTLPRRLLTANYINACREAAHFTAID